MDRRALIRAGSVLLVPITAAAQPAPRPRRIGMLVLGRLEEIAANPLQRLFISTLRELGWNEGREVLFEYRSGELQTDSLRTALHELVALNVDLIIVTTGVTAALAAKEATATIPILAIGVADPVKFGLVASLAHPGGNVTGLAGPVPDWGKYLELAREVAPGLTRVAVIANPTSVVYPDYVAQNEAAARQLGLKLQMIPVAQASGLAAAFEAMKRQRAEVLVFGPDRIFYVNLGEILERSRVAGLPAITSIRPAIEAGAVLTYGLDTRALIRQSASYADRILRGTKPADLPFEQPTRYELVINRKTAKALGLKIPQSLLLRADEVIE
ncbi:MAG: ABC transporter substrate-binding protein [Burkholderiales bacterium]